jgi:hypothetical protein
MRREWELSCRRWWCGGVGGEWLAVCVEERVRGEATRRLLHFGEIGIGEPFRLIA